MIGWLYKLTLKRTECNHEQTQGVPAAVEGDDRFVAEVAMLARATSSFAEGYRAVADAGSLRGMKERGPLILSYDCSRC